MNTEKFDFQYVITHSTVFHADDVFGVAMCKLINPKITIVRTLDPEACNKAVEAVGGKALIFDIGFGKYDHHQPDKAMRTDGITPYCGFGLLWRDFGYLLCPEKEAWGKVDSTLVVKIDEADNGIQQNLLSSSIKVMNPNWNDDICEKDAFEKAVDIARAILKAHIDHANAAISAREEVMSNYFGGEILVLDKYLPWADTVQSDERMKDILFTVYPSMRGGWNIQTVPKNPGSFVNRMNFPEEWLGHADPERGIRFAHTSNFLIACDTKEQAIKVAQEAVQAGSDAYSVAYSI